MTDPVTSTIAALDSVAALTAAGIHAESSIFATPATAADIHRAVTRWANDNAATIDINPELRSRAVRVNGWIIAVIFDPQVDEAKRVVDVDALRQSGAL